LDWSSLAELVSDAATSIDFEKDIELFGGRFSEQIRLGETVNLREKSQSQKGKIPFSTGV
jgi:hypothetical protein